MERAAESCDGLVRIAYCIIGQFRSKRLPFAAQAALDRGLREACCPTNSARLPASVAHNHVIKRIPLGLRLVCFGDSAPGRLPKDVVPLDYTFDLIPNIAATTFSGSEKVAL
jgi:hypothetical protein